MHKLRPHSRCAWLCAVIPLACGSAVDDAGSRDDDGVSSESKSKTVEPTTAESDGDEESNEFDVPAVLSSSASGVTSDPNETPPVPTADPIFEYEELAPGVTSVIQPSYFADLDDETDPPVTFVTVGDAGTGPALSGGTGDLTVLLVFDKSSSMLFDWDGQTRWQVANESLRAALDGVLDELTIGVIRFPLTTRCGVPEFDSGEQIDFTSGREFVQLWQDMEHKLESLGTPLGAALDVADRAIEGAREAGRLEQRFRVVLVTDGEPNCGENVDVMLHQVVTWYEQGVETMVIGLPGSDVATSLLDSLAEAGGTGVATLTTNRDELGEALAGAAR